MPHATRITMIACHNTPCGQVFRGTFVFPARTEKTPYRGYCRRI